MSKVRGEMEDQLRAGAAHLGMQLPEGAVAGMVAYIDELVRWNRAYNLTAVREPEAMISRHLLDSLAIAPWIDGESVLDVGSGPGLPGIPLALCMPDVAFCLLDSNGKKTRFLRHVRRILGLENVSIEQSRVEEFHGGPYDLVTARAFAPPEKLAAMVKHLLRPGGRLLAMTGVTDNAPVRGYELEQVQALDIPGSPGQRHVLVYSRWPESSQ